MFETGFYLYTAIPQWGIFVGILLVILGVVEKKNLFVQIGWIILITIGIFTLSVNLSGIPEVQYVPGEEIPPEITLKTLGWQTSIGSLLAAFAMLLKYLKSKRYKMMGILTITFFVIIFFQYYHFTKSINKQQNTTEQSAE
jgi:hypothetical protein